MAHKTSSTDEMGAEHARLRKTRAKTRAAHAYQSRRAMGARAAAVQRLNGSSSYSSSSSYAKKAAAQQQSLHVQSNATQRASQRSARDSTERAAAAQQQRTRAGAAAHAAQQWRACDVCGQSVMCRPTTIVRATSFAASQKNAEEF